MNKMPVIEAFNHRRVVWAALALVLLFFLAQIWFRPLWRDEYWALFFARPDLPLGDALTQHMANDVHPPFYFIILHYWQQIWDSDVWARIFNVAALALAGWVGWRLRATKTGETLFFLFLVATSYWLVFYNAEVRMMGLIMLLSTLSVLVARNALDHPDQLVRWAFVFAGIGMLEASMHFYGSLWISCMGAGIGLVFLLKRNLAGFFAFALSSLIAILPVIAWIVFARPDQAPSAPDGLPPFLQNLDDASTQFWRGILVKTFLVNPALFIAAGFGVRTLYRGKEIDDRNAVTIAIGLMLAITFTVHFVWMPWIKERAFIVMIPGLLYLLALAVMSLREDQDKARRWARWIPGAVLIMMPLQFTELFRDREQIGHLRTLIAEHPDCAGQTIIAYLRETPQDPAYPEFLTRRTLRLEGAKDAPLLMPHTQIGDGGAQAFNGNCPIKVVAVGLLRGERPVHDDMRSELRALGVAVDELDELRFGRGHTRAWVTPNGY